MVIPSIFYSFMPKGADVKIKEIKDFKRYLISEDGKVYDTKNKRYICLWKDNVGYIQCNLYDDSNKKYYKRVHRLVAETYLKNSNNYNMVNHINEIKTDNRVSNLEWCNNSENVKHFYKNNKIEKRSHKVSINNIVYNSIREASEKTGYNRKTLTSILKKDKINNYGIEIKYV